MRMRFAAMALTLAAWSSDAIAGLDYTQVIETMMESQADNALTLLRALGPDYATTLQYTAFVDTTTGSFSYSLLPGQTYLGQSISLSTTGSYDSTTDAYNWTTSVQYGAQSIMGSGGVSWAADPPPGTGSDETDHFKATADSGTYSLTSKQTVEKTPDSATSKGTYTFAGGGTYSGTDKIGTGPEGKKYIIRITVPPAPKAPPPAVLLRVDSSPLPQSGSGAFMFTQSIVAVPEPSSLVLCGIAGVVGLAVSRARRRRLA